MKKCLLLVLMIGIKFLDAQHLPAFRVEENFAERSEKGNMELLGKWHNEFLDHVFNGIRERRISLQSEDFYHAVNQLGAEFLAGKGISLEENLLLDNDIPRCVDILDLFNLCKNPRVPKEIKKYLCMVNNFLISYSEGTLSSGELQGELQKVQEEATGLPELDRVMVQSVAAVARYSIQYWEERIRDYRELATMASAGINPVPSVETSYLSHTAFAFEEAAGGQQAVFEPAMAISFSGDPDNRIIGKMGLSDAIGAIQGATIGSFGGPIGAFAGALLGAGSRSVIRGLFYGFTGR